MAENSKQTAKTAKKSTQRGKGKPFAKGQSGNPGGRPKVPEDIRQAFREASPQACETLVKIINDPAAKDSDKIRAAETILDRAYGKPVQAVDLDADIASVPVEITFKGNLDDWSK